jgi:hypothetical protein
MAERYRRPPLVPREAAPAWLARWRFRVLLLLLLALLVLAVVQAVRAFSGANAQDPGIGAAAGATVTAPAG